MNFDYSPRVQDLQKRLLAFMDEHIYPNEQRFFDEIAANRAKGNAWVPTELIEELKPLARQAGLWNLFLPHSKRCLLYTSPSPRDYAASRMPSSA